MLFKAPADGAIFSHLPKKDAPFQGVFFPGTGAVSDDCRKLYPRSSASRLSDKVSPKRG
jgi:hypothetical protein